MGRLGIDIGGTFTDFIYVDDAGNSYLYKVGSTPAVPSAAISEGLDLIAADQSITLDGFLNSLDLIIHGTTVAINALIQGKGARTGLLCTEGFRDSFEIRLGYKEERYDFTYAPPPLLVPRYLRLPVRERVSKGGKVVLPLDEGQVREQIDIFRNLEVEAVAVSLLWSFLYEEHERRIGELLAEELPSVYVSLSVDILPQIREYDRTSTTILNSYFGPLLERYIHDIELMFADKGFNNQLRYMQVNGGFASGEVFTKRPVYAINSGPAAGPTAGIYFGRQIGAENIITVDMGGTSFDICLVRDGFPDTVKNVDVYRYRVGIPMMNIKTIGAGGGSIAWLDSGGILRVGPQSAEAVPGPACYGRGGTEPTVTDANLVLGYLNPRALLGGRLTLDFDAARHVIETKISRPLGLSAEEASHGIFEIVNHNMTSGIAEVSIERGYDPRDFAMVCGGGAGAVHAGRLAAELGIPAVVVPKVASAFCAFGEVVGELRHDYASSYATRLADVDVDHLNNLFHRMEEQGRAELGGEGVLPADVLITRSLDMRYVGQVHECTVAIDPGELAESDIGDIEGLFHEKHEFLYAYADRVAGKVELINLAVTARGRVPEIAAPWFGEGKRDPSSALRESRFVYFSEFEEYVDTPVYDGGLASGGNVFTGPAIVEEPTTTIVVVPGSTLELDPRGFYAMRFDDRDH